jgi:hypothetical protein
MTPDLPIPEAARAAVAEKLYEEFYPADEREAGVFGGERFDDCERIADLVLSTALPHLRSLQVETQLEYGRAIGRREAAEEIAAKSLRRAQLAERVPEPMRSGVREGMIVTWLAAQKLALEVAEPTSEPRTELPVGPSHPKDSQTAREALS